MAGGSDTVAVTVVVTPPKQMHQPGHNPVPHHPSQLAWTGAPIDMLTAIAFATVVTGTALVTAFRRRAHRPTPWGIT